MEEIKFTRAEMAVLRLLLAGATGREIAEHLGKRHRTVEAQRISILSRSKALNPVQLGYLAARQGIEPDTSISIAREPVRGPEYYRNKAKVRRPRGAGRELGRDL